MRIERLTNTELKKKIQQLYCLSSKKFEVVSIIPVILKPIVDGSRRLGDGRYEVEYYDLLYIFIEKK